MFLDPHWTVRTMERKATHEKGLRLRWLSRLYPHFPKCYSSIPGYHVVYIYVSSLSLALWLFISFYDIQRFDGYCSHCRMCFNVLSAVVSLLLGQTNGVCAESHRDRLPFFLTACDTVHMTSLITGNGSFIVWLDWSLPDSPLKGTIYLHTRFLSEVGRWAPPPYPKRHGLVDIFYLLFAGRFLWLSCLDIWEGDQLESITQVWKEMVEVIKFCRK